MVENKISIKVGGPAGSGIFTIGLLISKLMQKAGLNVVYTKDYPSLIRGGHNTCIIRGEDEQIYSDVQSCDVLVALGKKTIEEDMKCLNKNGILIVDSKIEVDSSDHQIIRVPFSDLIEGLDKKVLNTIAFGCVIGAISDEDSHAQMISNTISNHFKKKSEQIISENVKAAEIGYNFSKEFCQKHNCGFIGRIKKVKSSNNKSIFLSGNDAAAIGAIKAGVKFIGEYPMTPSSSFLHFMASQEKNYNITTKQTEDELAAINTVVGASVAGVRAMSATSGGGFALMNEAIGFAGIAENPLVCFECMRGGPSTGIPTYTDQGDLKFVINSSQGEFPIVVLAPGDVEEAFYESFNAFNIAEITQTPVIVLLDKHLASTQMSVKRFDTSNLKIDRGKYLPLSDKNISEWNRYKFSEDGISYRWCPGQEGGEYINSSYEHDQSGYTCEDGKNHEMMMEKRFKKLDSIPKEYLKPKMYGPEDADLTLVGWGSTKGSVLEAVKYLNKDGYKVNYMHFIYINPFDNEQVKKMLEGAKDTMILEANYTGQLRDIIREKTGFLIKNTYFKYDARPFYFEDVYKKVVEVLNK